MTFDQLSVFNQSSVPVIIQGLLGDSANAVPHFQKLCSRVTHVWGNRRGQLIRSAMDKPHPRGTAFLITVNLRAR